MILSNFSICRALLKRYVGYLPRRRRRRFRQGRGPPWQGGFTAADILAVVFVIGNDDIARFQKQLDLLDCGFNRLAGLKHNQVAAWLFQGIDKLLQNFRSDEVVVIAMFGEQCVGLLDRSVM